MLTTKKLISIVNRHPDYIETIERHAVLMDDVRIGTVREHSGHDGPVFFDPYCGTGGPRNDGKLVVTPRRLISRKYTLREAITVVYHRHQQLNAYR